MSSPKEHLSLQRRGFFLGDAPGIQYTNDPLTHWQEGKPVLLKGMCASSLEQYSSDIVRSNDLYAKLLDGEECDQLFTQPPYIDRLEPNFESLGCSVNEGDDQEIETVIFDALDPNDHENVLAEDLWMKASWLSFYEEDASLRFRFSFGIDLVEDVAADKNRQFHAAHLTEAIFPESRIITNNSVLKAALQQTLKEDDFHFVERIVYFNSPDGGAYLHHDRERGHAGVVFAQLSGSTFWLALPKQSLIKEISLFAKQCIKNQWPQSLSEDVITEVKRCVADDTLLAKELESFANSALIHLINETQEFVQQLIQHGHSRHLKAGDILLLPQDSELSCCWHSVFCLGEESGQALSFAIRGA